MRIFMPDLGGLSSFSKIKNDQTAQILLENHSNCSYLVFERYLDPGSMTLKLAILKRWGTWDNSQNKNALETKNMFVFKFWGN